LAAVLAACSRPPTALSAQPGDEEITLSWQPVFQPFCPNVDGYAIYEGTTPGGENLSSPISPEWTRGGWITTTATTYDVDGLTDGVTYYFTIRTVGDYGWRACHGPTSQEISATAGETTTYTSCWSHQLCVTTYTLPPGGTDEPYGVSLEAQNGHLPYDWTLIGGTLPGTVVLEPDGQLIGDLGAPGDYSFEVQVTDSALHSATAWLTIDVV
jgi:hypothetical protein